MLNDRLLDAKSFSGRIGKFYISIAGIKCAIISQSTSFLELLRERYRQFESSGPADYEIIVQFLPLHSFSLEDVGQPYFSPIKRVNAGNNYLLKQIAKPFLAVANTSSRKVLVKMRYSQIGFDSFLHMLFTLIMAEEGGVMLRASRMSERGRASIFMAPAGHYQTTVARLSLQNNLPSNELLIIKPHNSGFRVYGTPFRDELTHGVGNGRAELDVLYTLKRYRRNTLTALDGVRALMALYKSVSFFTDDTLLLNRVFDTCCNIVNAIPAYELCFRPGPSFWQWIKKTSQDLDLPVHTYARQ